MKGECEWRLGWALPPPEYLISSVSSSSPLFIPKLVLGWVSKLAEHVLCVTNELTAVVIKLSIYYPTRPFEHCTVPAKTCKFLGKNQSGYSPPPSPWSLCIMLRMQIQEAADPCPRFCFGLLLARNARGEASFRRPRWPLPSSPSPLEEYYVGQRGWRREQRPRSRS